MPKLRAAVAQINPRLCDIEYNVEKHLEFVHHAKREKVDLLVFPELSLTGYTVKDNAADKAIKFDDQKLLNLAAESGDMLSIVGFVELGFAAQLHNTSVALRRGEPSFIHRKLNLPNYGKLEEGKFFSSGRYIDTYPIKDPWHTSVLICADLWNPALVHLAAVKGATVLLVPTNSADWTVGGEFCNPDIWDLTLRFYSTIYGLPILMANRTGKEYEYNFWGRSKILNSYGKVVAEAKPDEEDLIVADLDYRDVVQSRAKLPTVRDSNLDLIHREIDRLSDTVGRPEIFRND